MSKTFTITRWFDSIEDSQKKVRVDGLLNSYLGSINVKEFGPHKTCTLKITFLDFGLDETQTPMRPRINATIEVVKLSDLEGRHKFVDFNNIFDPKELQNEKPA